MGLRDLVTLAVAAADLASAGGHWDARPGEDASRAMGHPHPFPMTGAEGRAIIAALDAEREAGRREGLRAAAASMERQADLLMDLPSGKQRAYALEDYAANVRMILDGAGDILGILAKQRGDS